MKYLNQSNRIFEELFYASRKETTITWRHPWKRVHSAIKTLPTVSHTGNKSLQHARNIPVLLNKEVAR